MSVGYLDVLRLSSPLAICHPLWYIILARGKGTPAINKGGDQTAVALKVQKGPYYDHS